MGNRQLEPKVMDMKIVDIDYLEYSNKAVSRLRRSFNEYSIRLGLRDMPDSFSTKSHVIRICMEHPEIRAVIRPNGGKVINKQCADLHHYMMVNPVDGFTVSPDAHKKTARINKGRRRPARPGRMSVTDFYKSWEWKKARYRALKEYGPVCMLCGMKKGETGPGASRVRIVVDHIKPLRKHWDLRLELANLQVLCDDCNRGKGSWDETDWRGKPEPW